MSENNPEIIDQPDKKKRGRPRKVKVDTVKVEKPKYSKEEIVERERIRHHKQVIVNSKKNFIKKWSRLLDEFVAYNMEDSIYEVVENILTQYASLLEKRYTIIGQAK